tara:strand:- start:1219 stop:1902 length:684 start_codon:yes stop_codon:yes gene_type:complete
MNLFLIIIYLVYLNLEKLINVLITARGGSKRLPQKNIKVMCGKPLIYWTIEAAKSSSFIKDIFVSTDSPQIAQIAKEYGAIVPRLRSSSLAEDNSSSFDTVIDFKEYFPNGEILLLQPTSPLRLSSHIDELMKIVKTNFPKQCVAVRDITKLVLFANLKLDVKKNVYIPNGSMYYSKIDFLEKEKTFFSSLAKLYIMDRFHSTDIDNLDDWNIAEACLKKLILDEKI